MKSIKKKITHIFKFLFNKQYRKHNSLFKISNFYLNKLNPLLAYLLTPISYIFFLYLRKYKYRFIVNTISQSPGHVLMELDWFFRHKKYSLENYKYGIIWPKSEVSICTKEMFNSRFDFFIVNNFLFRIISLILLKYPELTIDFSLSHLNYFSNKETNSSKFYLLKKFFLKHKLHKDKSEIINNYTSYYKIISKEKNFFPLSDFLNYDNKLKSFIGTDTKYAVIQIKNITINNTLRATDPKTYVKTIKYLQQKGLKIIFAGREKMPKIFFDLDILNYSEWQGANFKFDMQLIKNSQFVLSSASGFGLLADTMGVPLVWTNFWQIGLQLPGKNTIFIPTLLKEILSDKFISFKNQCNLFYNHGWVLNELNKYEPQNADEEDIYEATKESFEIKEKFIQMNENQIKFNNIKKDCPSIYCLSRLSNHFAKKYISLFN